MEQIISYEEMMTSVDKDIRGSLNVSPHEIRDKGVNHADVSMEY